MLKPFENRTARGLLPALTLVTLLCLATGPQTASADTVVLNHFEHGNTNATLNFTAGNYSFSTDLHIGMPRGAAVVDANVSVRGIEGAGMGNHTMDFSTHSVGQDMWARYNASTGLLPLTVDVYNNTWNAMPSGQVANVSADDGKYWHTQTPSVPSTAPWEVPVQLFHFRPNIEDAAKYEFRWKGKGHCAANKTYAKYQAHFWIYDHGLDTWQNLSSYWYWWDEDVWFNDTFLVEYEYVSSNGSLDVALAGPYASVNGTVKDRGHLYTDYVGLVVVSPDQSKEHPKDVTLKVLNTYIPVSQGPLDGTVTMGRAEGLADAIQDHIDHYPQQPGNVTVAIEVYVAHMTYARVEVFDLEITYDDSGVVPNDPPEWVGPSSVEVAEDSGWKTVLDMDLAFTDDYDQGELAFEIVDISDGYIEARLRELVLHTWLEVRPMDDFHGEVDVTLGAADKSGASTEAPPLTVTVTSVPDAPFILNPGIVPVNESERLAFTLLVLDPDMPDDTLTFSDTSDLFDVDPDEGSIDWTPTAEDIGTHSCTVTAVDGHGLSDTITLVIEVRNLDDPPVITSDLRVDALEGERFSYTITAEDPDLPQGDSLTFSAWSYEMELEGVDPLTGTFAFTPDKGFVGEVQIFIRVTDSTDLVDLRTLVVVVVNINDPPSLEELGRLTYQQGDLVSVQLEADDPDLWLDLAEPEVLRFLTEGPSWLAADADGWVNLTVGQSHVGEHLARYTVRDREGLEHTIDVVWDLRDVNDGPVISTGPPASVDVREDEPFSMSFSATDVDGDDLTWSDDSPLFNIDPASGTVAFTPVQADVGTHVVTVTVSDGRGGSAIVSFDIEVVNVNDAPVITSVQPAAGTVYRQGEPVRLMAMATDEDGDVLEYVWKDGIVEAGTGNDLLLEGLSPGSHEITLLVSDGNETTTRSFNIVVEEEADEEGGNLLPFVPVLVVLVALIAMLFARKGRAPVEGDDAATGREDVPENAIEVEERHA